MAFRGRGGGRGFGGGFGRGYAKEEPFLPFPEIHLPDAKGILSNLDQKKSKGLKEDETLIVDTLSWLMKSEYNLDKAEQGKDVEESEGAKRKAKRKFDSFSQYLVPSMFPKELTKGANVRQVNREDVKWNKKGAGKSDELYWNQIEKREQSLNAKKQKEGENDEEEENQNTDAEEEEEEEEEDEDPSDDDYAQHEDFDDDEDDFNADEGEEEAILDV